MNSRLSLLILVLALIGGIGLGFYAASSLHATNAAVPTAQSLRLTADDQNDYILNIADAYAADSNLNLAQDRLARLRDPQIAARVEGYAINYASKRDLTSVHLIQLAIALGSKNTGLIAVVVTATPVAPRIATRETRLFLAMCARPWRPPVPPARRGRTPRYRFMSSCQMPIPTLSSRQRRPCLPRSPASPQPAARARGHQRQPTPPCRPPFHHPPLSFGNLDIPAAPPGVYFAGANLQPGEKYWHLVKAVYCDFIEENFGCPDRPGNTSGTSIYVINGGAPIDVIRPDGTNVGGDATQIGDLKAPEDMCECSWTWLVSDYRVSVAGAPSDAIGGFALYTVGGHVLEGHAHVRYFLYFDYITR